MESFPSKYCSRDTKELQSTRQEEYKALLPTRLFQKQDRQQQAHTQVCQQTNLRWNCSNQTILLESQSSCCGLENKQSVRHSKKPICMYQQQDKQQELTQTG
jgi:hypothetical protein